MKQHNYGLDLLRIICMFTVVLIHTPHLSDDAWRAALRYLPFANACFAFMAGMFLIREEAIDLRKMIRKRVVRLLFPYLAWTAVYVVWGFCSRFIYGRELMPNARKWLGILFFGEAQGQLWFIIFLFYVQIFLALLLCRMEGVWRFVALSAVAVVTLWSQEAFNAPYIRKFSLLCCYCSMGVMWHIALDKCGALFIGKNSLVPLCLGGGGIVLSWFMNVPMPVKVFAWIAAFQFLPVDNLSMSVQNYINAGATLVLGVYFCHHLIPAYFVKKALPLLHDGMNCPIGELVLLATGIFTLSIAIVLIGRKMVRVKWLWG